ncbi:Dabb family protein [Burkholderia sp. Bp9140]|uniref:Dabb family protein n=1 Tax=Burkholderia sp. Bp9140 TaxID=2184572 RepID=UPI000F55DF56|nr:Dabb family protein [Burkholderia sp. Bp9140]RQR55815.1 Dabb family protein [Burkholderia sp. Bp9140]
MRHETAQVYVSTATDSDAFENALLAQASALPGRHRVALSRNLQGSWGAGDYTLDLLTDEAGDAGKTLDGLARVPGIERLDAAVCGHVVGSGTRAPNLSGGVWRTLMLHVRDEAGAIRTSALEQDLLMMPAFIPSIRNWRLTRIAAPGAWTHVWQQEFAHVDDLLGEYLMHPYHWGWVDRWFDVESPDWTVDAISHAFCPLASSLLAGTPIPIQETRRCERS